MAKLEVRFSDGAIETKRLTRDKSFIIGTDPSCDLMLTGQGIEPKHATIRWADRRYRLEVAPSIKNVFSGVNPVSQLRLKPDAEFSIGRFEFRIRYDSDELGAVVTPAGVDPASKPTPLYLSKPFLGIVGGLVMLAVLGVGLYFLVRERAADRQFEQAEKDLRDKLYPEAGKGFDQFIASFTDDPRVDQAIYLRAKARVLPLADAGGSSLEGALNAAQQWVDEAGKTKEYAEHPTEIGDIILSIARKLAEQSRDRSTPQPLALSEKAVALLTRALPPDKQPVDDIARVQTLQEEARLAVSKGKTIEQTLVALDKSLTDRTPATTYELHRELVHQYPDMRTDRRVKERLQQAANIEKELVRFDQQTPPVKEGSTPWNEPSATSIVRRAGPAEPSGPVILAQVADTLYGIDTGTGQIKWRSVVGFPSAFPPAVVPSDNSIAIVYRGINNSITLIDMLTGKERSRLELGPARPAPSAELRFADGQIWFVCSPSPAQPANLVGMIKLADDQLRWIGSMIFPQALAAVPEWDADRRTMIALANESTLYTVSVDRKQAEQVYSLGHEAGSIQLRPLLARRFLFVVEEKGIDTSLLHLLVTKADDGSITQVAEVPIVGLLDDLPIIRAGRILWASNRGERKVFELGAETDPQPLTPAASLTDLEASAAVPTRLLPINDEEFWVLSATAKRYRLAVEKKELANVATIPLVGPARRESRWLTNRLVSVAADPLLGGLLAQGWTGEETSPTWSTQLGPLPSALFASDDGAKISLDSPTGVDLLTKDDLQPGSIIERPLNLDDRRRIEPRVDVRVIDRDSTGLVTFTGKSLHRLLASGEGKTFPLPAGAAGQLTRLQDGILVPSSAGYLYWINVEDGKERSDPFASPYSQGSPLPLRAATAVDPMSAAAGVWCGGKNSLFLLQVADPSHPLWTEKERITLPENTDIQECHVGPQIFWAITNSKVLTLNTEKKSIAGEISLSLSPGTTRRVNDRLVGIDADGQLVSISLGQSKEPVIAWRSQEHYPRRFPHRFGHRFTARRPNAGQRRLGLDRPRKRSREQPSFGRSGDDSRSCADGNPMDRAGRRWKYRCLARSVEAKRCKPITGPSASSRSVPASNSPSPGDL
jgi:hypothetical protein